jgi:integrase
MDMGVTMPKRSITDAFVRNVRPPRQDAKPNQVVYLDRIQRGLSLCLVVSYGGSRSFRCVTYKRGKAESHKLDNYPEMSVKQARDAAKAYYEDPERFTQRASVGSFKEIGDNWLKRHVQARRLRSEAEITRHLHTYVYPDWGERKFLEIRRREVNELLDHIADNHGSRQADAVLATIRSIMGWHETRDDNYTSPIVRKMNRHGATPKSRILSDAEIRQLWEVADGTFGALCKICLLTAQRRTKVARMRWVDLNEGEWTIASEEREKGNAGKLKLPDLALTIINQQPKILNNPFVFAGRGATAYNSFAQGKRELDAMLPEIPAWTLHDLRRTARSLMSKAGILPHLAERVLGHAIGGVQGIYDRHAYDVEKAHALDRLSDQIARIINPPEGNVVPLRG